MKLEAGMYVRTYKGIIDKLDDKNIKMYQVSMFGLGDKPIKTSNNIKELIKERDFVKVRIDGIFINWFMVDLFEDENENQELGIGCYEDGLLNSISEYRPLNTLEILEVVTKEQFESISYEVN